MKKRLLLIDGTNFFFKGNWNNSHDLTVNGKSVKCLYAFHLNLPAVIRKFEDEEWDCTTVVCWDGGHEERTKISNEAVSAGIIEKAYKQERREARSSSDESEKKEHNDFFAQLDMAKEMLSYTRINQVLIKGEEADDLVGSLCKSNLGSFDDIVLVTTDKDYYQLLWDGVRIYNSSKHEFYDKNFLKEKYGLNCADQWVEVGILTGETGPSSDTIYGVPGIGTTFACKLIQEYGTVENIIKKSEGFFCDYISKNGYEAFKKNVRSGEYKPSKLKEAKVLAYRDVLEVGRKLKKIHTEIPITLQETTPSWKKLDDFFQKLRFNVSPKNFDTLLRKGE